MEETQLTDNVLAPSPRAGRWLGILRKKAQAIWHKLHPLALL